ncbi:MAG: HAD-IIIA family hydrolase [Syntrophobacter sp.]
MSRFPVAVLAGGLATRLRPLTEKIPKILLDVAGKPFAVRQLEVLRRHGVKRVVYCLGYLGEQVRATLGDGSAYGMELQYIFDGPTLLGTGGALRNALNLLDDSFLVLYGDSYLEIDYAAVEDAFSNSEHLGLMTVLRNSGRWDRSNVLLENDRIICYDKTGGMPEMRHIDFGLGALRARAFDNYPANSPIELASIYQDLLARNKLGCFEVNRRFYEIGSHSGLEETRRYVAGKETGRVVFLDRDGVINKVVMRDGKPCSPRSLREFELEDGAKEAVQRLKDRGLTVIVVTNQPDIARGKMDWSDLDAMTQRVYTELGVDDVRICPHDDRDGCTCRKPRPGMLLDGTRGDFPAAGFLVGDSWKDMEAGRAAGCLTVLIERSYNRGVTAEYLVHSLRDAVQLILKKFERR